MHLDPTDLALIDLLQQDGRMTLQSLYDGLVERKCAVALSRISERVKELREANVIRIRAVPDPAKIGLPHLTLLLVRVGRFSEVTLQEATKKFERDVRTILPFVTELHKTAGECDFILKMLSRDEQHFLDNHAKLAEIDTVANIVTVKVFSSFMGTVPLHP